ncbi:hypothetical protein JCM24511_01891 [Saitozyma sp. JCM 24511]|nr:hypothetical protein JCM24511_01891 [Saitozyma sp. JCM 24511]
MAWSAMNGTTHLSSSAHPVPDMIVTPGTPPSHGTTLFFPDSKPQDLLWWIEPLLESEHGVTVNQNEWTGRMIVEGVPLEGVRIRPHSQLYPEWQSVAENWPEDCDSLRLQSVGDWSASLTFFDSAGNPTTIDAICTEVDEFNSFWESSSTIGRVATFRLFNVHNFPDDFPRRLLSLFGFPVLLPTGCSFSSISDGPISNATALHLYSIAVLHEDGALSTGTCISSLGRSDKDLLADIHDAASAQGIAVVRDTERWANFPRNRTEVHAFAAEFEARTGTSILSIIDDYA